MKPTSLDDRRRGLVDVVELGEHHERLGLHRAADEHGSSAPGSPSSAGTASTARDLRRPAEHEAHRAVLVVMGDQHDRLAEVRIEQDGDETSSFPCSDST